MPQAIENTWNWNLIETVLCKIKKCKLKLKVRLCFSITHASDASKHFFQTVIKNI